MALSGSARAVDELLGVKPSFLDSIVGDSRDNGFGNTHHNTSMQADQSETTYVAAESDDDREWNNRAAVMAQLAAQRAVQEVVAPVETLDPAAIAAPIVAAEVGLGEVA